LALLARALRAGHTEATALLFNMNRLFESAVATVARRRVYEESGPGVEAQGYVSSVGNGGKSG
jgi:5-methylcytosine-specific restriction endonuclease McrBC regulatory subunit McrC